MNNREPPKQKLWEKRWSENKSLEIYSIHQNNSNCCKNLVSNPELAADWYFFVSASNLTFSSFPMQCMKDANTFGNAHELLFFYLSLFLHSPDMNWGTRSNFCSLCIWKCAKKCSRPKRRAENAEKLRLRLFAVEQARWMRFSPCLVDD